MLPQRSKAGATFSLSCPEPVKISFFGTLNFGRVGTPSRFIDNGIITASLLDLAAQKVKVILQRAECKDYLDIATLLKNGVTLAQGLGAAQALYPTFSPILALKALTYYNDGDLAELPDAVKETLTFAVAQVRTLAQVSKTSENLLADGF